MNDSKIIEEAIKKAIIEKTNEEFDKQVELLVDKLKQERQKIVGGIATQVSSSIAMDFFGKDIRITIKTDEIKR